MFQHVDINFLTLTGTVFFLCRDVIDLCFKIFPRFLIHSHNHALEILTEGSISEVAIVGDYNITFIACLQIYECF